MSNFFQTTSGLLRLRGPLAADPTARTLHVLLAGVLAFDIVSYSVQRPFSPNKPVSMWNLVLLLAGMIGAQVLLRRGALKAASVTYLTTLWVYATIVVWVAGGIRSFGVAYYMALPILAAWLLGYRAAIWNVALSLAGTLLFAIYETIGFSRFPTPTPFGAWIHLTQATIVAAVPIAHTLRRLSVALSESRRTQDELEQYRDRLEELVHQRTAELVEARNQADDARQNAEKANRAKSVFLANMSHELRTPLNAILGFSSLLRDGGATEQQRHDLEIINRSGEHLLALINDILDIAKIEAGRTELSISPCDLERVVQDVVDLMRVRAAEKNLALAIDKSGEVPRYVQTDGEKLREVLINLLGNAVKYTERGAIALRVKAAPDTASDRVLLRFEVEDTGIGIAPEDQSRIFDPFEQGRVIRGQKGTGLGLAITREIVRLMGGRIAVESTLGKGSCFRMEIPVVRLDDFRPSVSHCERVIGLEPGQPLYRVLVADDEQENWMVLDRLLQGAGFQVRVAENGEQAVDIFREWRPHFIWMDLRMPVMNGMEATARIRSLAGTGVKIAAVTASGFESQRNEVLASGLDDYVRKPYRPEEIFACMARHLGVRYQHEAPAPSTPSPTLNPDDIASLPCDLHLELRDAITTLDSKKIAGAIERVKEHNPALASVLARLSATFSYTAIIEAIDPERLRVK